MANGLFFAECDKNGELLQLLTEEEVKTREKYAKSPYLHTFLSFDEFKKMREQGGEIEL